ncbi:MAG: hypothetical protein MEQ84_03395 [Mesorhizobium sp.]|nr:hypothetical protein [Mesorhizobium sp.]
MVTTERLRLRRARMDGLVELHWVFSHTMEMRYWDSLPHDEIEQTKRLLTAMVVSSAGRRSNWIAIARSSPLTSTEFLVSLV